MLILLEPLMLLVYSLLTVLLILMIMQHLKVGLQQFMYKVVVILDLNKEPGQEILLQVLLKYNNMIIICILQVELMVIYSEGIMEVML